jgi:RimJ/RimL family protein N-acetyltransferase
MPCDARVLYESWLDPDVQRGFNGIYAASFEEFSKRNKIDRPTRFSSMIRLNSTGEIIGTVGVSPPEDIADLTIRIFKAYRRQGYGTSAFALATKYVVDELKIEKLHAGAYADNIVSQKMLKKCGYIPYPEGNITEKHYITGEDIVQMDYIYKPITICLI